MKNVRLIIAMLGLLTLFGSSLSATEKFRRLDTKNGLFNNQVRFVTQMQDGKILVYTEGMFNVYDGDRVRTAQLRHPPYHTFGQTQHLHDIRRWQRPAVGQRLLSSLPD